MATLESIKVALRQKATEATSKKRLSDSQYGEGLEILVQGSRWRTYEEFIIPQLSTGLGPLFDKRTHVSVLEVGPGPKSVLGHLPLRMRRKIFRYTAFEPNRLFASQLGEWLSPTTTMSDTEEHPMPRLGETPDIRPVPFTLETALGAEENQAFDVVLFCHSMYGLKPHHRYLERALEYLNKRGWLVMFHRERTLQLNGLVCHEVASFPDGTVSVAEDDQTLDRFSRFVTGFDADEVTRAEWREVCRALGHRKLETPGSLMFDAPEVMMAFKCNAASALPQLAAQVPLLQGDRKIKSWEARACPPAAIVRPTEIRHIQHCVRWALDHGLGLTVIGGSHSAHCLRPQVVAVDMSAFDRVHILARAKAEECPGSTPGPGSLVVVEAGCDTGTVIRKTMEVGLTVPLGSRPSVGAGLWLQGGIGHLARMHGLTCDAILGAVMVDVNSGQVLCIGDVPSQHRPSDCVRPDNHTDILWAIKGAGTNFGIVVSVAFQAQPAPAYSVRNWVLPLNHGSEAQSRLGHLGKRAASLPRHCSADLYLYRENDQLTLGVTRIDVSTGKPLGNIDAPEFADLGPEQDGQTVDGVGLFGTEMYMSGMNGGHGGGKTSSFKRCMFLKNIGADPVSRILVAAIETCPSSLCYLHLLQGGGRVGDVGAKSTAFGSRDWDYACVVTGVWSRDQDGTEVARSVVGWVYRVVNELLPLSSGVYAADLGPDPRDSALASRAFGPNRWRLAQLKQIVDLDYVLAYTCPLPGVQEPAKAVILVTGDSGAGKDYCAEVWISLIKKRGMAACVLSISDETKREYAKATGASLDRLLGDRPYKEKHREALSAFFQSQVQQNPNLPEEHFLDLLGGAVDAGVLFITGMRDEAPIATLAHLRPDCRFLDIRVQADEATRRSRKGHPGCDTKRHMTNDEKQPNAVGSAYRHTLVFDNHLDGKEAVERFAEDRLLPLLHEDLSRLYKMVNSVPSFPRYGVTFRHVLNIAQEPDGLALCANQLMSQFHGDWSKVDAVACCEAGGFVFASALAARVNVPLALIREAGKLAPPTVSTVKSPSHISSVQASSGGSEASDEEKRIEMDWSAVHAGASVVVVDDVLATGKTLCAVLQLLKKAGVEPEHVSILAVAEFPVHRGRELLRKCGYGSAHVHSLLVFDGA
ncbi:phosphoribosyl transferase domain protein [Apiospora sp. TS-2023a]